MSIACLVVGKGYIGTYLQNYLTTLSSIETVQIVSRSKFNYVNQDLFLEKLTELKTSHDEVIVINCVGYTGKPNVDACEKDENKADCWHLNAILPTKLALTAKQAACKFIHISSGCIYDSYDKCYTEDDMPNFGLYSNKSSFYSKSKHAAEESLKSIDYGTVLRIRMPFCSDLSNARNTLFKLTKYTRLISHENSMTSVRDLTVFIGKLITDNYLTGAFNIYNVVNEGIVTNKIIVTIFKRYSIDNKWLFVDDAELKMTANRSNTVISTDKIKALGLHLPDVLGSIQACIRDQYTRLQ